MVKKALNCFSRTVTSTELSGECKTLLSLLIISTGFLVEITFVGMEYFNGGRFLYLGNYVIFLSYLAALFILRAGKPLISSAVAIGATTATLCFHLVKGEIYSLYWFPLIPLLAGMVFDFKVFLLFTYAPIFLVSLIFSFQLFDDDFILFTMETYKLGFSAFAAYLVFSTVAALYKFLLDRYREELQTLLERDYLTGVLTRRALFSRLKRIDCRKSPYSVIMADIDNFKMINDTFGHQAGDRVLKELGSVFKENLRRDDFVGRYGGEEFMIVLPKTDKATATLVAEKLRKIVENRTFDFPGKRVTVSFGVADCREGKTVKDVVELADERLYKAKRLGKNRVITS